jgi:hypothetical protein
MKTDTPRCKKAFDEGTLLRRATPLRTGEYKLHESYRSFVGWRDEITRIGAFKDRKASRHSLRHCTPDDCSKWLKDLPEAIAFQLAYDVLPAISALVADGVPSTQLDSVQLQATPLIRQLITDCDRARVIVVRRIANEYEHMKVGGSYLTPLVSDAIRIMDDVYRQAGLSHP